jgi:hypothetical protein
MTKRLLHTVLIVSIAQLGAMTTTNASANWRRHAPEGAGFSVEAPGEPDLKGAPEEYGYSSGLWMLGVKIRPVDPAIRQLVERRDRKALDRCLESIRDTVLSGFPGKTRDSSTGEIDGYPSIRFSFDFPMDGTDFEANNLLVLTSERFYMVMTVGPKGLSNQDAKRFLRSFRLVTNSAAAASQSRPSTTSANPLATKLAEPLMAVARLVIEERMNPLMDEVVQNAPPAARLGNRWTASTAAWQQARRSISRRIERVANSYGESGEAARTVESELEKVPAESQSALAEALNGPAGPAIVRELARSQFVTMMMLGDPNGPKPGERAWMEKQREMRTRFEQRIGSAVPVDDHTHDLELQRFFSLSATSEAGNRLSFEVVETATREIEGAINLMMFEESAAIQREIETVIASVK